MCDVILALEELCLENIDHHWLGVGLELVLFAYAFVGLAIVCDDYLVPALETLCFKWRLSEDVAGATFMALGSGAPELILSSLVTLRSVTNESLDIKERHGIHRTSGLGVATILGSGWVAYLLIPACCTFLAKRDIYVNHGSLLRDILFYLMALSFLYKFGFDRAFTFMENLALILGYFLYTLIVLVQSIRQIPMRPTEDVIPSIPLGSIRNFKSRRQSVISQDSDGPLTELAEPDCLADYTMDLDEVTTSPIWTWRCFLSPLHWVFGKTLTTDAEEKERHFLQAMMKSFLWVSVFSWTITVVVSRWIKLTALSSGIFGVSLVAFGGQIPDAIQSVAAAKKGHGSMALGNALGSQNLNVFLGLGVPWLFCSLGESRGIEISHSANLFVVGKITFCVVLLFALLTLVPSALDEQVRIPRCYGIIFLGMYIVIVVGYTAFALQE